MNNYINNPASTGLLGSFLGIDGVDWVIGIMILALVFFLLREYLCWYWKINEIVSLLEDIKKNTTRFEKAPVDSQTNK